ncbi:MAG: tetratricopeptide repeat protein [Thermodesulfobacteriota bacterium]|nr:tetratricopeptide repeat protein [Thermodesulfobacteriota bacterium]
MVGKKIKRKQLKQPDEFITFSGKVIQWSQKYGRQISYAAIALVGIVLASIGYRYFDNRSELKAFTLLSRANANYAVQMQKTGTQEKAYEAVKADYQDILDNYSGKNAGKVARKTLADICFNAGRYDQAINLYERSLKDFEKDPFYHTLILSDIALAQEANSNDEAAIKYFEMVANTPDPPAMDQALFHLAGLYEKVGKPEKAREFYEKIITEHIGSIYIDIVKEKIAG